MGGGPGHRKRIGGAQWLRQRFEVCYDSINMLKRDADSVIAGRHLGACSPLVQMTIASTSTPTTPNPRRRSSA
jgi:hypothetical protein